MNVLEHTMVGIDRILNGPPASTDTARKSCVTSQSQEDAPHAGLGSVEAGLRSSERARVYALERLVEQLYDLMPERMDDAYDLVRAEYLRIHGL